MNYPRRGELDVGVQAQLTCPKIMSVETMPNFPVYCAAIDSVDMMLTEVIEHK